MKGTTVTDEDRIDTIAERLTVAEVEALTEWFGRDGWLVETGNAERGRLIAALRARGLVKAGSGNVPTRLTSDGMDVVDAWRRLQRSA